MSAHEGFRRPRIHSHREAYLRGVVRTLERYGALTEPRLLELLSRGSRSEELLRHAVRDALRSGLIRRAGDVYTLARPSGDADEPA